MMNRLDYPTSLGKTVADVLFAPLLARGMDFRVIDAGARNGMFELPGSYAAHADFIGFEPNAVEYEKLTTGTTDAARYGYHSPRWKAEAFHPCALWNREEERPFFITVGPGACTLMGEIDARVARRMYLHYPDQRKEKAYHGHALKTERTTTVKCRRLDDLVAPDRPIDYFKLDVEGAELAVLEGSAKLFAAKRILFVKTEFVMVPYYEVHPLFGQQQILLDREGLRFLGFDFEQMRYTRDRATIPVAGDRRLIYAGDAYFTLDPDRNELDATELHRIGIMSIIHGFLSYGLSVIRDGALLREAELDAVIAALARVPLRSRARYFFQQFPYYVARRLASARAQLHRMRG